MAQISEFPERLATQQLLVFIALRPLCKEQSVCLWGAIALPQAFPHSEKLAFS